MNNYNKHVIIVGSARSGTSWLSETMAQKPRYRLLFEPEHEFHTTQGHLLCDTWIEPGHQPVEVESYLKQIFLNKVDNNWIAQNSNRKFKRHLWPFIPKKYIIKFIRTNLLANYMTDCFKIPVIHLIRNPYDTIASQFRANFPWLYDLSRFKAQKELVSIIEKRSGVDLNNNFNWSKIELLTLRWCIENVVPLEVFQSHKNKVELVRYEELRSDVNKFIELCKKMDLDIVNNLDDIYTRPSSKTHPARILQIGKGHTNFFSKNTKDQVNSILNKFGTALYPLEK